jgi:hypothetical protein
MYVYVPERIHGPLRNYVNSYMVPRLWVRG